MNKIYIQNPRRYLNARGKDFDILGHYGDYSDDELRGLVEATIIGFNSLRDFSRDERIGKNDADFFKGVLKAAERGFRAATGKYSEIMFVFGKPEIIETTTKEADKRIAIPANGYPLLDHDNDYIIERLKVYSGLKEAVVCFDLEGNVLGVREVVQPQSFILNGTGEEIVKIRGGVEEKHRKAAYISGQGLSSVVLSRDGIVIGFYGGHALKDLTYNHDEWNEERIKEMCRKL